MERKIGLDMQLPEGKLPGFYAQIVKGLAGRATLFDRDKEMLILNTAAERDAVLELLAHYQVTADELELLLLPEGATLYDAFADYGFTTRSEHNYLYKHLVCEFRLLEDDAITNGEHGETERRTEAVTGSSAAEPAQALRQMEEYVIASLDGKQGRSFVVDREHKELMEGIAKAYRCSIAFES